MILFLHLSSSQECHNDTHPEAAQLRKERVRAYRMTRPVTLDCQANYTYLTEAYLIVDRVTEEDSGEYIFKTNITYLWFPPIIAIRSVNVSISELCKDQTLRALQKGARFLTEEEDDDEKIGKLHVMLSKICMGL